MFDVSEMQVEIVENIVQKIRGFCRSEREWQKRLYRGPTEKRKVAIVTMPNGDQIRVSKTAANFKKRPFKGAKCSIDNGVLYVFNSPDLHGGSKAPRYSFKLFELI